MGKLLISICLALSFAASISARGWKGIVPLHSTRADVESLLGKPLPERDYLYQTENDFIRVDYAKGPCDGWPSGWNVIANTVLSISVRPNRDLMFSDLHIDEFKFSKAFDDTFTTYYANRREGIQYGVSSEGIVRSIKYFPSIEDVHLRCKCFPADDGSVERSVSFDQFSGISRNNMFARLDNFAIQLSNSPANWRGYIIAYSPPRARASAALGYRKRINDWLVVKRGIVNRSVAVVDGGHRETFSAELFLFRDDIPPPPPLPTVGSCVPKRRH